MLQTMIENGKVVDLCYTLKNSEGDLLDQADREDCFTYLHGTQQIVPGLESALTGLKVGEKKQVVVSPAEGYGEFDPKLQMAVKRSQFPEGATLEEGTQFQVENSQGEEMIFTVEAVEGDQIHVDGNHPLAGEVLHFDVEVLRIRDATAEELTHGHAHGPDGHHHH